MKIHIQLIAKRIPREQLQLVAALKVNKKPSAPFAQAQPACLEVPLKELREGPPLPHPQLTA